MENIGFDFKSFSESTRKKIKQEILKRVFNSYINSNEAIDKFSNWSLAISGTMIPLMLLNLDKITPFYENLNSKLLMLILIISSSFGLLSKYFGYKINSLKPVLDLVDDGFKNIYKDNEEAIDILDKAGFEFEINDQDNEEIFSEFKNSLNVIAKSYLNIRSFINPNFLNRDILSSHKKSVRMTSTRHMIFILQLLTLVSSFFYLIINLK
ncbi:MAG: hypothetical protein L3J25_08940 [Flavobacteriaceae bacterium]|nr:hypothetical protein [Flavobacteriaceae bacterium]